MQSSVASNTTHIDEVIHRTQPGSPRSPKKMQITPDKEQESSFEVPLLGLSYSKMLGKRGRTFVSDRESPNDNTHGVSRLTVSKLQSIPPILRVNDNLDLLHIKSKELVSQNHKQAKNTHINS